ncbi:MAG: isopeptide-forming domain-containing fimbrial protein [Arenicella sp.]
MAKIKKRSLLLQSLEERILWDATLQPTPPEQDVAIEQQAAAESMPPEVQIAGAESTSQTPPEDNVNDVDQSTEIEPLSGESSAEIAVDESLQEMNASASAIASEAAVEIVVVDGSVENKEALIQDILEQNAANSSKNITIVEIDSHQSGIDQVTDVLRQSGQSVDAVHVVGHGDQDQIFLGADRLSNENLGEQRDALANWAQYLSENADILFYGCDVVENEGGAQLLTDIADITGADVSGSTDTTGSERLGGDWDLEFNVGSIETDVLLTQSADAHWSGVLALDAPIGGIDAPASVMIDEDPNFTLCFDSPMGSDPGFGPFGDLVTGEELDITGITYLGAPVTFTEVGTWDGMDWRDSSNNIIANHPFDATAAVGGGNLAVPTAANVGDTWFAIELPFGSYTESQPKIGLDVAAEFNSNAEVGAPIDVSWTPGYLLGSTADGSANDAVQGTTSSASITPEVIQIEKRNDLDEQETVTGPNYPVEYTITINVADGETVNNVIVTDYLPANSVFLGDGTDITNVTVTPINGGTSSSTAANYNSGTNTLSVNLGDVDGAIVGAGEIEITYFVYFQDIVVDGAGTPNTNNVPALNESTVTGVHNGVTVTDSGDSDTGGAGDGAIDDGDVEVDVQNLSTQKTPQVVTGFNPDGSPILAPLEGSAVVPGALIYWTVDVQVSDYHAFDNLAFTDQLSDGQEFVDGSSSFTLGDGTVVSAANLTPTLFVANDSDFGGNTDDSTATAIDFDAAHVYTAGETPPATLSLADGSLTNPPGASATGEVTTIFDISGQLRANGSDGVLVGDLNNTNDLSGDTDDSTLPGDITVPRLGANATTLTLTFFSSIREEFTDVSGDAALNAGDPIGNDGEIEGDVGDVADDGTFTSDPLVAGPLIDDTSFTIEVAGVTIDKSIYAVNQVEVQNPDFFDGSANPDEDQNESDEAIIAGIQPGDEVTYRIRVELASVNAENFKVTDFLPLPVYDVDFDFTPDQFTNNPGDAPVTADFTSGNVQFGEDYNLHNTGLTINVLPAGADPSLSVGDSHPNDDTYPQVSFDAGNNQLIFDFGTFNEQDAAGAGTSGEVIIDLLITATVLDNPISDSTAITNQAQVSETDSSGNPIATEDIVQIQYLTPDLAIQKGVVAIDSGSAGSLTTTGPNFGVNFANTDPGVGTPATDSLDFAGNTITLAAFQANNGILDSDVEDVDGGDHVRYAITVYNEGQGDAHDILVQDQLPDIASGFIIPGNTASTATAVNDLNLQIYDGQGNRLTAGTDFTVEIVGGELFVEIARELDGRTNDSMGNEIADSDELVTDPNPGNGNAAEVLNAQDGDELFIIVYDLEVDNEGALDSTGSAPDTTYTNTAQITEFYQTAEGDPLRNSDNNVATATDAAGNLIQDDLMATAEVTTPDVEVTKAIISSDLVTAGNSNLTQATVGERITYEVRVQIPEGEVLNARLIDNLQEGLELSSIDSVRFEDGSSNPITSIQTTGVATFAQYSGPSAAGELLAAPITTATGPLSYTQVNDATSQIDLQLGTLLNTNDDATIDEFVVLTYTVMVINDAANVSGANRANEASLAWQVDDGMGGTTDASSDTDSASIAIVEPELEIVKTVEVAGVASTGAANDEMNPDTAMGDIGDVVTYTIVIQHTSDSDTDAYDVTFSDQVPAEISSVSLVSAIYSEGLTSDLAGTDIVLAGNNITTANDFTVAFGETVTVTVTGVIGNTVNVGDVIDNTGEITYTSYPEDPAATNFVSGTDDTERGPDGSPGELDGYNDSDPARIEITANSIEKYLVNSELTNEMDATADGQLAAVDDADGLNRGLEATIGETLTYEVVVTVSEGITNNAMIEDVLDPGLVLVSLDSIETRQFDTGTNTVIAGPTPNFVIENQATLFGGFPAADASNAFISYTHAAGNSSDTITLNLGDITNTNDNNTIDEQIVLRYTVMVSDIAANAGNAAGTPGTQRNNSAELTYTDAAGTSMLSSGTDSADNIEIVEPDLEVVKGVSVDGLGDAGDEVTYTITIQHTGDSESDAFDVSLADVLPTEIDFSGVNFAAGTNITVTDNNSVLGTSDFEISAGSLQFAATANTQADEAGNNTVDFQLGATPRVVTIEITGVLLGQVQPGDLIENDASIQYSSLDQHDDGSTNPVGDGDDEEDRSSFVPGAAEDSQRIYTDTDDADFTAPIPTIAKELTGSDVTTAGNAANQATIGELVTYTITVGIPEGDIDAVSILDTIDPGLEFFDVVSVSGTLNGSNVVTDLAGGFGSVMASGIVGDSTSGQSLNFNLGNLTTAGDNSGVGATATAQGDDFVVIEYRAVVTDIAANVDGRSNINNSAQLSYETDATTGPQTLAAVESAPISLVEPELEVIKQINGLADEVDASNLDAGDAVTYLITIQHTGDSSTTAFDTQLNDILPSVIDFTAVDFAMSTNVVVTDTASTLTTADFAINAGALQFDVGGLSPASVDIELGRVITVAITGVISDASTPNSTISNQADINYTSLPEGHANDGLANERGEQGFDGEGAGVNPYDDSDDIAYTTSIPTIAKALTGSDVTTAGNAANQATIGELVTYTITVGVPEGDIDAVSILDTIDPGLEFFDVVSVSGTLSGSNVVTDLAGGFSSVTATGIVGDSTSGQSLNFNLGNLTTTGDNVDDEIVIVYRAVVTDIAANVDGRSNINNAAQLSYETPTTTGPQTLAAVESAPISLVEPELEVIKQINGLADEVDDTNLDAGDTVTYLITIQHTGDSSTTAFDTQLSDVLPSVIDFSAVDFAMGTNVVVTDSASSLTTSDFAINAGVLQFDVGGLSPTSVDIELGRVITVEITGVISNASAPNSTISNQADINYTSLPEGHANDGMANERGEQGFDGEGAGVNPYDDSDDIAYTTSLPVFEKSVISTSIHGNGADSDVDLTIGEEVTYELVVTLTEGTTPVLITDNLPNNATGELQLVGAEVSFIGAGVLSNSSGLVVGDDLASAFITSPNVNQAVFNFGNVVVDGNNVIAAEDNVIKVQVTAVVVNTASMGVNEDGDELTNTANLNFSATPATPDPSEVLTDSANVDVIEPELGITKAFVDPTTGAPVSVVTPGQTVRVQLTVENTGTANAYDVVVGDLINDQDLVFINPVAATTPAGYTFNFADGGSGAAVPDATDNVTFTANTGTFIAPSGSLIFEFDVTLTDAIIGATQFEGLRADNTATVTGDTLDGDPLLSNGMPNNEQRDTSDDASDSIAGLPGFEKTVLSSNVTDPTNGLTDVTIGERVVYQIEFEIPDSDFDGDGVSEAIALSVTDNLPDILELKDARVISIGADITAPGLSVGDSLVGGAAGITGSDSNTADGFDDRVVLNFGNVIVDDDDNNTVADQTIIIEIEAIVKDDPANIGEDPLDPADDTINDKINVAEMTFGPITQSDSATVEVVEPELTIEKNFVDPTTGQPIFSAQAGDVVQIELQIENTGTAVAYDVFVEDALNAGVLAGQYVDGSAIVVANGGFTDVSMLGAGQNLVRLEADTFAAGATATFRIDVTLSATLALTSGDTIDNTATVEGESLDVDTLADPTDATDSRTTSDQDQDFIFGIPSIEKEVADNYSNTGDADLLATSHVGTSSATGDPALEDLTVGEIVTYEVTIVLPDTFNAGQIELIPTSITDSLPAGLGLVDARVVAIGGNQTVGDFDGGEIVTSSSSAVLLDAGGGPGGATLSTNGSSTNLAIGDSLLSGSMNISGTVGGSSVTFDFGGIGTNTVVIDENGDGIFERENTALFTDLIGEEQSIVVQIDAVVLDSASTTAPITNPFTNTATLTYVQSTASPTVISDTADVEVVEPDVAIEKSFKDPVSGVDLYTINPGQQVLVELSVTNTGQANAYDVVVNDEVDLAFWENITPQTTPPGFVYTLEDGVNATPMDTVVYTMDSISGAGITNPDNFLAPAETVVFEFLMEYNGAGGAGFELNNTAEVEGDALPESLVPDPQLPGGGGSAGLDVDRTTEDDDSDVVYEAPSLDKEFTAGLIPNTGTSQFDPTIPDVGVGEVVVYDLTVTLPESPVDDMGMIIPIQVNLIDDLPDGFGLVGVEVTDIGSAITSPTLMEGDSIEILNPNTLAPIVDPNANITTADNFADPDMTQDQVTLNFGTVTVDPNSNNVANQTITVQVTAVVLNISPENDIGEIKTNEATLEFFGTPTGNPAMPFDTTTPIEITDSVDVEITPIPEDPVETVAVLPASPSARPVPVAEPELSIFDIYSYDVFDKNQEDFDELMLRIRTDIDNEIRKLPVSYMATGITEHGSNVTMLVYSESGAVIGYKSVLADAAGNWVMTFPNLILNEAPHHVEVHVTPVSYNDSTQGEYNTRVYYTPALDSRHFHSKTIDFGDVLSEQAETIMESQHQGNMSPLGEYDDDWNHPYEFLAISNNEKI